MEMPGPRFLTIYLESVRVDGVENLYTLVPELEKFLS